MIQGGLATTYPGGMVGGTPVALARRAGTRNPVPQAGQPGRVQPSRAGAWVVLRVTDPAEPGDARAWGEFQAAGDAVAYTSPFYLVPAVPV